MLIVQGEKKTEDFFLTDDGTADGTAQDLTDAVLTLTVRKKIDSAVLFSKSSDHDNDDDTQINIVSPQTGGTKGHALINFVEADTSSLDPGNYHCDIFDETDTELRQVAHFLLTVTASLRAS